jgi:cbb3-type cytochrome oxidase cytochrome c subunit
MKNTWLMIVAAAGIIIGLVILSSTAKKAPFIPADTIHRSIATQEGCVACHAPGKQAPLKADHPPKEQCLICHKIKKN